MTVTGEQLERQPTESAEAQGALEPAGTETAICVRNVSKVYKIYSRPLDLLIEAIDKRPRHQEHWALRDISLNIPRGAVVGIIGPNGAGKSTLLKIIVGTLQPTSGSVEVNGKIAAILELGTGFHDDYSGRENIVLGGMCAGMSREQIAAKVPSIIAFSELESVIDQPFKTYSSGMKARLTFATAISIDAEILVIDEALAAGDAYFVHKCMERVHQICRSGATVFFVSHSTAMIERLCNRAIWIDKGQIMLEGATDKVCAAYEHYVWSRIEHELTSANCELSANVLATAASGQYSLGNKELRITSVYLCGEDGRPKSVFIQGERALIRIEFSGTTQTSFQPAVRIDSEDGACVTGWNGLEAEFVLSGAEGGGHIEVDIGEIFFGQGNYYVSAGLQELVVVQSEDTTLSYVHRSCKFSVRRRYKRELAYVFEVPGSWRLLRDHTSGT
jgi:lipopolysaccharide transport system ATP-binding protein